MTNNLDVLNAAPASGSRFAQQNTAARQSRWMLELEQAMLANGSKTQSDAAPYDAQDEGAVSGPRAADPSRRPGGSVAAAAIATAGAPAAAAPAAALATAMASATAAAAARPAAAAADKTGARQGPASATDGPAANTDDSLAGAASSVAAVGPAQLAALGAYPMISARAYSMATAGALTSVALAGEEAEPAADATAAAALPPAAPKAMLMAPGQVLNLGAAEEEAAATPESAAGEQATAEPSLAGASDGTDYAERLMHLYHSGDGVQAWIRDAALNGGQLPGLALAMASELEASGTTLTALTVNGKKQALPPHRLGADLAPEQFGTEEAASVLPSAVTSIDSKGTVG